ncbi:RNA polymerase sigma factor [Streptomyces sp. HPF1205]|uniref:RNA polymerase sigma factor n=1 Tax=Streptomyces sp. HPF1205 TaxID=2873262 RepID=UPI0035AB8B3E
MARTGGRRIPRADDGPLGSAVARARAGDEAAFGVVYRALHPMLLGYVRALVGGDDADDVTSDAWHDIVRDLHGFHGDGAAFRGWAATIARHRALDHLRRAGSRPRTTALEGAHVEQEAPDSAGVALENLSTARALDLIAALPRDQAEAVLLRVVLGLSGPAAAEVLGKRPGAVRTAAYRGLRRLAERIAGPGAEPGLPGDVRGGTGAGAAPAGEV